MLETTKTVKDQAEQVTEASSQKREVLSADYTEKYKNITKKDIAQWINVLGGSDKVRTIVKPEDLQRLPVDQQKAFINLVSAYLSDFDGDGKTEIANKFRLFGRNANKQSVGEAQLFNIFKNNPSVLGKYLQTPGIKLNDIDALQNDILKKVNALSDYQKAIIGEPINAASVDILTALA